MTTRFLQLTDLHFSFPGPKNANSFLVKHLRKVAETEKFDVVIVSGDLGTSKQEHLRTALKTLREVFGEFPIAVVFGNHDYWDRSQLIKYKFGTWDNLIEWQNEQLSKYNIHNLERKGPLEINDINIFGYDGWYLRLDPPTNDGYNMPDYIHGEPMHKYMNAKAHHALQNIFDHPKYFKSEKKIVVTHFGFDRVFGGNSDYCQSFKNFEMLINDNVNAICYGHSHKRVDAVIRNTRVLNPGGGYKPNRYGEYNLDPEHLVFEL